MSKRIRVLHLLTSLNPGGAETNLLSLVGHFDHKKYDHAVAYGGGGTLIAEFSETNVKLIQISETPLSVRDLFNLPSILKKILAYAPDIIHSHLDLANVLGLIAKHRLGCRLILHFHGLGIIPRRVLPGRSKTHILWNYVARFYRYCDVAIAICDYQLSYLSGLGFKKEYCINTEWHY